MTKQTFLLSELQEQIRAIIEEELDFTYHITAEIASIQEHSRGHAYLELIEKDPDNDRLKAKARATIWSHTYRMLKPYFQTVTGENLKAGMKIAVSVHANYHPVYGFSLEITDIEPEYTLGDIERRRLEVLRRLEEDGVMDMNKETDLSAVPQRLAIISSETAAGLEDFLNQLSHNPYGYTFYIKVFPALMQGDNAPASIVKALENIFEIHDQFDTVIIVRGGGSKSDLACFDDYQTAVNVAQFPLPVISGIGHERDISIVDMLARKQLKTPTAVAEFLVNRILEFETKLDALFKQTEYEAQQIISEEYQQVSRMAELLKIKTETMLQTGLSAFNYALERIEKESRYFIQRKLTETAYKSQRLQEKSAQKINFSLQNIKHTKFQIESAARNAILKHRYFLENTTDKIDRLNPSNILKLGYSYTKRGNAVITDASVLNAGDVLVTRFYKGEVTSDVKKKD